MLEIRIKLDTKVIITADAFQPQQGLPDCRQHHFVIGLRRLAATARLPLGQGQCLAIHLARWGERVFLHKTETNVNVNNLTTDLENPLV